MKFNRQLIDLLDNIEIDEQLDLDNDVKLQSLLTDFNVRDENELQEKLIGEMWNSVECSYCFKKYNLNNCEIDSVGNLICPNCGKF